jgi:hypothetical protein
MRLSPQHKHLASLMAQGLPNREIKKLVEISDSRLSVLRRNPLIVREVERLCKLEDSKYSKALEEFGKGAQKVAQKLVKMATEDITVSDKVRKEVGFGILSLLGESEGFGTAGGGKQVVEESFEQTLRLTRSRSGQEGLDEETLQQAYVQLADDEEAEEQRVRFLNQAQVIEVEPIEPIESTKATNPTDPFSELADDSETGQGSCLSQDPYSESSGEGTLSKVFPPKGPDCEDEGATPASEQSGLSFTEEEELDGGNGDGSYYEISDELKSLLGVN